MKERKNKSTQDIWIQNKPPRVITVNAAKLGRIKSDVNPCVILWEIALRQIHS